MGELGTQEIRKVKIDLAIGPNPPWTNLRFKCAKCPAEYQLGAADECRPVVGSFAFLAPPCWHCGHINHIHVRIG